MKRTSVLFLGLWLALARPVGAASLAISFDGKGTAWAWDAGVMRALLERLSPGAVDEVLIVGASSGSIVAAYTACREFGYHSLAPVDRMAMSFRRELLNEDLMTKSIQLVLGVPTENKNTEVVDALIAESTLNDTCVPKHPVLIVAANSEVLDGSTDKPFAGRPGRRFDKDDYVLYENGRAVGKGCTYFVDPQMQKILSVLPEKERLCDLRPIETGRDLHLAILASISEPTYFGAVREPNPEKIVSVFGVPKQRIYRGGFVMNSCVQDIKRARPKAYVFGTGRTHYTRGQDRIVANKYGIHMNAALLDQRWFFDEQIELSKDAWNALYEPAMKPTDHLARGYATAKTCLDGKGCKPKLYTQPKYTTDFAGEDLTDRRRRGLRAILKPR